jgi:hypothetical protein
MLAERLQLETVRRMSAVTKAAKAAGIFTVAVPME